MEKCGDTFTISEGVAAEITGVICIAIGGVAAAGELFYAEGPVPVWAVLVVAFILLVGAGACLTGYFRRLEISGDVLTYVNSIGRRRSFAFSEIAKVKAALNREKSQDFLILYGEGNRVLCKLGFYMNNTFRLLQLLRDRGIAVDISEDKGDLLPRLMGEENIAAGDVIRLAAQAYVKTEELLERWRKKKKLPFDFTFGLVEYRAGRLTQDTGEARRAAVCSIRDGELPEDYVCVLELYGRKDGRFVMDRRGKPLCFVYPVIRRVTRAGDEDGAVGEGLRYEGGFLEEIKDTLELLEKEHPRRLTAEEYELGYELKKEL